MEVKEESLRTKNELEKETKERRNELQKYENRVLEKNPRLTRKQMQLRSVKRNAQREQLRCRKKKNG